MSLPIVGESLDPGSTLEAKARRAKWPNVMCHRCRTSPFPRGWVANRGLCWTCVVPCGTHLADPPEEQGK